MQEMITIYWPNRKNQKTKPNWVDSARFGY